MSWHRNGETAIGTFLKSKILEPLVSSKRQQKPGRDRSSSSVITDGMPSREKKEALSWNRLGAFIIASSSRLARLGRKSQQPQNNTNTTFLQGVRNNRDIEDMAPIYDFRPAGREVICVCTQGQGGRFRPMVSFLSANPPLETFLYLNLSKTKNQGLPLHYSRPPQKMQFSNHSLILSFISL
ncbi:hypothetical protein FA15DRAFT_658522 [Coprinopsis marcescibilis]|uniref:Uncharacterized protein n=1 Tax=Coprinopsis marcescibilis TaxID=230819 RepID=A0A5C3KLL9_COPMA|nr:hypothetical protein FA15DRAFT_658522 [Coprinopsis marcescibilis]